MPEIHPTVQRFIDMLEEDIKRWGNFAQFLEEGAIKTLPPGRARLVMKPENLRNRVKQWRGIVEQLKTGR